jgi:hypothetical protein
MLTPAIQDKTVHVLKMKWDAAYRAEFEALQADLAQAQAVLKARGVEVRKAAYHSTIEGDITKDADSEMQSLAALLATIELVSDPIQRRQIIKDWASR